MHLFTGSKRIAKIIKFWLEKGLRCYFFEVLEACEYIIAVGDIHE